MAFIANNNNPLGGGVPGQARNSMAQYPPRGIGGGFAGTKPLVPPRNRFTPGNMGGASTGQDATGAGVATPTPLPAIRQMPPVWFTPGNMGGASTGQDATGAGVATPTPLPAMRQMPPVWWSNPTARDILRGGLDAMRPMTRGAGAVTGGGYQGGGGGAMDIGGNRQARQIRRQMERQTGQMTPDAMAPPGAMDDAMDATGGNPSIEASGANRAGMGWRDARRQALQSGDLQRTEDGFASTNPGDATGANRAGMDWRAQRRDAKRSGAMDVTGADRIGMGYRRDRRQAARAAAAAPPAKPGQPPAM